MPEVPELEVIARRLTEDANGLPIAKVQLGSLQALKTYDPPLDSLVGKSFQSWHRVGKYLVGRFADEELYFVTHLSLGGWVHWRDEIKSTPIKLGKGPLAVRVAFEGGSGFDLTEAGTEKRLSVWLVRDVNEVERLAGLGPDIMSNELDAELFRKHLAEAGGQVKSTLVDQHAVAGVGNAYSDEALHIAKLSPFLLVKKMTPEQGEKLFNAVRSVLNEAIERAAELGTKDLKKDKKSHMRVHGRTGEKCPECGDVVREVLFVSRTFQYCATCQTGGKVLADRRMSKLLK